MPRYDYDLFTIGAGSGGVRASRFSADFGARVAVAEVGRLGGTCVNLGCIPKKLLVYASHFSEELEDAASGYGWTVSERSFDWSRLIANKDREIARLNEIYRGLLSDCDLIEARASLIDPHTVAVDGKQYTAETILVATGGWPTLPEIPGIEYAVTSNEMFHLDAQPERVIIVGGGYIAVEFAGILHGLGSRVTQLYRGELFLRGFDDDMRSGLAEAMRERGIDLRFKTNIDAIERVPGGLQARLDDGSTLAADLVLYATGRHPNSAGLGLEPLGVELNHKQAIVVDEFSRSSVPSIYAIGDVTDRINLTPVAIHEGVCLSNTLFNDRPMKPDHRDVPSAVFSQPAIGSVGLTEVEARERYSEIDVYRSSFGMLKQTLTERNERAVMKLIVERASDRVVGLHVLAPDAAEMVQGFAVAIKSGATKASFDATIGIHPSAAEELVTLREPVTSAR